MEEKIGALQTTPPTKMEKEIARGLGWSGRLGMVDTIFEEEEYIKDLNSSISSPHFSSPSSPDLPSSVEAWYLDYKPSFSWI